MLPNHMIQESIHLGRMLDPAILDSLADFICGDNAERFPVYRSSSYLTRFFQNINIPVEHDGSTRKWWVLEVLKNLKLSDLEKVILRLVDLREYKGDKNLLRVAVHSMNEILLMENLAVGFNNIYPILKRAEKITLDENELTKPIINDDEKEFLKKQFDDKISIQELGLDAVITSYLQSRVEEIQSCPREKVPLGNIFLLGSTLEGVLLAVAIERPSKFMSSKLAPKDKNSNIKKIYDWKLSELIDVANEIGMIGLDVKKFSHVLRDFRNYIHPYHQMLQKFNPDQHTVDICWQVFKAAFSQLKVRDKQ